MGIRNEKDLVGKRRERGREEKLFPGGDEAGTVGSRNDSALRIIAGSLVTRGPTDPGKGPLRWVSTVPSLDHCVLWGPQTCV